MLGGNHDRRVEEIFRQHIENPVTCAEELCNLFENISLARERIRATCRAEERS